MKRKKSSKKSRESPKANFCLDCQFQFDSTAKYKYHRLKEHGKWHGISFPCGICDKSFSTKSNSKKHQRLVHQKEPGLLVHVCNQCEFKSNDAFNLKVHQRKHSGEKPFECSQCQRQFAKKSDLTRHHQNISSACTNFDKSFLTGCRPSVHRIVYFLFIVALSFIKPSTSGCFYVIIKPVHAGSQEKPCQLNVFEQRQNKYLFFKIKEVRILGDN